MDISDKSWDEAIEASMCYIDELQRQLKDTHFKAERQHIEYLILKEKTIVNLMNRIEHLTPYDIFNIPDNPYMKTLCHMELINSIRDECNKSSITNKRSCEKSQRNDIKTVKNSIKNEDIEAKVPCKELKK